MIHLLLQAENEDDQVVSFEVPDLTPYQKLCFDHDLFEVCFQMPAFTIEPLTEAFEPTGFSSQELLSRREWSGHVALDPNTITLSLLHVTKDWAMVEIRSYHSGEWWSESFSPQENYNGT